MASIFEDLGLPDPAAPKDIFTELNLPRPAPPAEQPLTPLPKSPGVFRQAGDLALRGVAGAAGATKALTDAAGANNPFSRGLQSVAQTAQEWGSDYDRALRQRGAERMQRADGPLEEAKAAAETFAEAPFRAGVEAAGSIAPTAVATIIARRLGLPPPAMPGMFATMGAAQGAGSVKGQVYQSVYQEAKKAGKTDAEAQALADQAQAYGGANTDQILLGTGLGAVANTTGAERVVRTIFGGRTAQELAKAGSRGVVKEIGLTGATEAATEGVQGGQEQLAGNIAAQRAGFDVPTWQGVAGQATTEGLAGGVPGATMGAVEGVAAGREARARQAADADAPIPVEPVLDPGAGPIQRAAVAGQETGAVPGIAESLAVTPGDTGETVDPKASALDALVALGAELGPDATFEPGSEAETRLQGLIESAAGAGATEEEVTRALTGGQPPQGQGEQPVLPVISPIDEKAHQAATSPLNDRPEPTPGQIEAGNYAKGHLRLAGMDISIENPAGSTRSGTDRAGNPWSVEMQDSYGYVRRSKGADGDQIDVFIKPGTPDGFTGNVFVVDQVDPETGEFDEAKAMIGYGSQAEAEAAYRRNYADDWQGMGAITAMPIGQFHAWATSKPQKKPLAGSPAARVAAKLIEKQAPDTVAPDAQLTPITTDAAASPAEGTPDEPNAPAAPVAPEGIQGQAPAPDAAGGLPAAAAVPGAAGSTGAEAGNLAVPEPAAPVAAAPGAVDAGPATPEAESVLDERSVPAVAPVTSVAPAEARLNPERGADAGEMPALSRNAQGQAPVAGPTSSSLPAAGNPNEGSSSPDLPADSPHLPANSPDNGGWQRIPMIRGAEVADRALTPGTRVRKGNAEGTVVAPTRQLAPGEVTIAWDRDRARGVTSTQKAAGLEYQAPPPAADATRTEPSDGGGRTAGAPEPVPMFESYADAQAWVSAGAQRAGGKRRFESTPEYREAYPQIKALYDADRKSSAADAMARLADAGLKIGDRVQVGVGGFLAATTHTGTLIERGGFPVVKIDGEMDVSRNGRIVSVKSLPWDARWTAGAPTDVDRKAEAAMKRAAGAERRYREGAAIDTDNDTLLMAIAKLGGIDRDQAAREWGAKPEELRHPSRVFGRPLFRKTGGLSIDDMRLALLERGYLTDPENANEFEDKVFDGFGGIDHLTPEGTMLRAERERAERDEEEALRETEEMDAEAIAEREAIQAESEAADALDELDTELDFDFINALASEAAHDATEGITDEQIAAIREDAEAIARTEGAGEAPTTEAGGSGARGSAQPGAPEGLTLTGQTEAEARAESASRERERTEQARRDAAPPPEDFTLAGSDRAVDRAIAAGQRELEPAPAAPIADFGEKIEGARKDAWASHREQMQKAASVDVAAEPLSKSWPAPDYQALIDAGADPWAVAFIHAARDAVPAKPKKGWKLKEWVTATRMLREVSMGLIDGTIDADRAQHAVDRESFHSRAIREITGRTQLYEAVGHSKSLAGVRISMGAYSLYEGVEYNPPKEIWTIEKQAGATAFGNWPRVLASGDTKEAALADFKRKFDSLEITRPASKEATFEVYSKRGQDGFWVGKKIGRNPILLEGPFPTVKDARAYKDEHSADLVAKLEKARDIPNERRDTNQPRVGEDMRGGANVTPEMFQDAFGFRGVQFGNYVEQGRRQKDLNDAYDALMDMAAVLGIPPKAISLNGELGLAFGARGKGGKNAAAAHYERGHVVINLTKREGAGSLGHEWWHALDNYFSRMRGRGDDFMTASMDVGLAASGSKFIVQGEVRREMIAAYGEVLKAIRSTALKARASKLDAKRSGKDYWTINEELTARAYESYLISKLQDQGASNDYLANIVDEKTWAAAEKLGFELDDSYPYPTAGEVPAIRAAFDHFFQTVQTRETDRGVALFSRGATGPGTAPGVVRASAARIRKAWPGAPEVSVVATASDLPFKAPADAEGAFHDGRVWLVAENLPSVDRVARVLLHEVVGHHGVIATLGQRLAPTIRSIYRTNADVRSAADRWMADNRSTDQIRATEEAIAQLAERGEVTDQPFWSRLVAAIRNAIRALGIDVAYSDADVQALLAAASRTVRSQPRDARGRFAPAMSQKAPVFVSALAREVAGINARSMPAAGWKQQIGSLVKKGQAKQDEVDWTGLAEWLDLQTGKVPKEAVQAFLAENGVRVEETMLGDLRRNPDRAPLLEQRRQLRARRAALPPNAAEGSYTVTLGSVGSAGRYTIWGAALYRAERDGTGRLVWKKQGIFGRTASGRSMSNRLREELTAQAAAEEIPIGNARHNAPVDVSGEAAEIDAQLRALDAQIEAIPATLSNGGPTGYSRYTLPGGSNYRELLLTLPGKPRTWEQARDEVVRKWPGAGGAQAYADLTGERRTTFDSIYGGEDSFRRRAERDATPADAFRSGHWDVPNVLAHVRFNERRDADGKRVLFVEEIQSDWGQEGKRKGFRVRDIEAERERLYAAGDDRAAATVAIDNASKVPSAPFVGKTDAWVGLALKRMIRYAAENGFDKVAFVNGEQSAERYDLSKQISRLRYEDNSSGGVGLARMDGPAGSGTLTAWNMDGDRVIDRHVADPAKELPDLVGKEVADRLLSQPGRQARTNAGTQSRAKELSGLDLKVGGEGMRTFYDQIVPKVARDVLKKLGGNLETVQVRGAESTGPREPDGAGGMVQRTVPGEPMEQIGFTITPAMREQAMAGLPLFSRAQEDIDERLEAEGIVVESTEDAERRWANGYRLFGFHEQGDSPTEILSRADLGNWTADQLLALPPQARFSRAQTDSEAFRRWFGDSKVVDEAGQPLRVYHGSIVRPDTPTVKSMGDITSFDRLFTTKFRSHSLDTLGSWFSTNPGDRGAEMYAGNGEGAVIYPVYLSIQNPHETTFSLLERRARLLANGVDDGRLLGEAEVNAYRKWLRDIGKDGIKIVYDEYNERGSTEFKYQDAWIALEPEQIKSAIGNTGTFDPANPDIRFSRASAGAAALRQWFAGQPRQQAPATPTGAWDVDPPSKMDDFLRSMQDKMIDLKRVTEAIRAAGKTIEDRWNPYLQEELFHGRTATQTKGFIDTEVRPLITEMALRKVSFEELGQYLHARHAPERNAQMAKINPGDPEMQDGGSGMTNQEAADYMAALTPERRRAFESMAAKVDAINRGTTSLLVASGLEKQETIDAWNAAYKHYVPLMRDDTGGPGIGQGFSVRGSASKRAMGSKKAVVDIIANVALQRERAIIRAEKNRVAQALWGLAVTAPNRDFWMAIDPNNNPAAIEANLIRMGMNPIDAAGVAREPQQRYVDPRTGLVSWRVNPLLRSAPNVVSMRVNGEEKYVALNQNDERAVRMASAIKNLDADQLGRVLSISARITRYFAAINTQWNPLFAPVNLVRDVQGGLVNLTSTPIAGRQAEVMRHTLSALKGIYTDLRATRAGKAPTSGWAQLFEEFRAEGGQTGYRDMFANSAERSRALESELRKLTEGKAQGAGRAIFDWLSDYNDAAENSVRLAVYKVGIDHGLTRQQAASIAKNISVNFNRKGQIALQAGALYAFFNASAQGTARMVETLKGPSGRKIIYGGILLGAMQALVLAAAGFDDDEPPEFVRERNIIIPIGGGKYLTIPMPLGLHVIPNLGRIPVEFALSGFRKPGERLVNLLGVFADAFNPIGNAGFSLQTLAPTLVDPIAALSENRDFAGRPIARENFSLSAPKPGHLLAKDTASTVSKAVSYAINLLSGGTAYKPGVLSPTPDQIDYLIGQVTGGVGREILKGTQTLAAVRSGEDLPPYKIPLIGRFYGDTTGQSSEANRFYENLRELNGHKAEIEGRSAAGEPLADYLRDNPTYRLVPAAQRAQRQISKLRAAKRQLIERGADKAEIKQVDDAITAVMRQINQGVAALEAQ